MDIIKQTFEYLTKLLQWWIIVMPWESGIRVRFGKHITILKAGTYFRIPLFDSVYIQTIRLRVASMPLQTITTQDGKTLSIVSVVGYSIENIDSLYNKLFQPETTIANIVLGGIAEYVSQNNMEDCSPEKIEKEVFQKLNKDNYGIKYDHVKIIGYAIVKTFRLIQDSHWMPNGIEMNLKQ